MFFSTVQYMDIVVAIPAVLALLGLIVRHRRGRRSTTLNGPPAENWVFGLAERFFSASDPPALHTEWAEQYGAVFAVPQPFGHTSIVLCDPKACAHFHAKETVVYHNLTLRRNILIRVLGNGIFSAEGEVHKRQRRGLSPAFSNAAIRKLIPEFYDSAHKLTSHWDNILVQGGSSGAVIEVQHWMNKVSLDSLGHAAFSYDFGTLDGRQSDVFEVFEAFTSTMSTWSRIVLVVSQVFPWVLNLPTKDGDVKDKFSLIGRKIAYELLEREKSLVDLPEDNASDQSVLGTLLRSERSLSENNRTSPDEVVAQIKSFVMAGYETTSTGMTWILIELCLNPEVQTKLRNELFEKFPNTNPTWDDLWYKLPYLDAVVLETLRLHPILPEVLRIAVEDDVIPLSRPAITTSGEEVSSLFIAKGSVVSSSIGGLNRSKDLWGANANQFIPERWLNLEGSDLRAKEIQGHKHILSFSDGVRLCLGKNFALAEIKAVMSVVLKNYVLEFEKYPNGMNPAIEIQQGVMKRPRLEGHSGAQVPLRIRKVEL